MIIIGIIGNGRRNGKQITTDEINALIAEHNALIEAAKKRAEAMQAETFAALKAECERYIPPSDIIVRDYSDPTRQRFAACLRNIPEVKPKRNQPNIKIKRCAISERR